MTSRLRLITLRTGGVLLVVLGILHLGVTPLIDNMLKANVPAAADWITPPMLLNHVVVGILLLPLGILTIYAAPYAVSGVRWAIAVSKTVALTVATLPVILFVLMGTRYFGAVPFLVATGIVCAGSITLLLAAFWPLESMGD